MDKKIVFLDVDGTMINYQGVLPDSARKAINEARANGHKVYIITQNNEIFKGYLSKKWVVLDQRYDDVETGDGEVVEYMFFYTNGGSVYYKKKAA